MNSPRLQLLLFDVLGWAAIVALLACAIYFRCWESHMTEQTQSEKPTILCDTYGTRPPRGAVFDKGFSDTAGAHEAQDARRNQKPGDMER